MNRIVAVFCRRKSNREGFYGGKRGTIFEELLSCLIFLKGELT